MPSSQCNGVSASEDNCVDILQAGYSLLTIDETGKTALHYGARFGHKEVLRFLIAKAPERALDMVDAEKGQTALHKAAAYKRRTICCMLVAAGASLLIRVGFQFHHKTQA